MEDVVERRFNAALEALANEIRADRSILAAVLCGSLAYDRVWEQSDIDLVLVTIDDKKVPRKSVALYAAGVNVHAFLIPRAEIRAMLEGSVHSSFMHSFLVKGRLLYTHDETIARLFAAARERGDRDRALQLLRAGIHALPLIAKAHKFFLTRGDLDYTALWILHAANPLAHLHVVEAGLVADREVLPQALELNPPFFTTIYTDLLNHKKTRARIQAALDAIDEHMARRAVDLFAPIIEHLREASEARPASEIEEYFGRHYGLEGVTTACEYLADQRLIAKTGVPVRLTHRSNVQVEELSFVYLGDRDR